jgi:hypothetical protein
MSYGKVNIFISYAKEDNVKMEYVRDAINSKTNLNAIVVPEIKDNLVYNSEKIIKAINRSSMFLAILTPNSISNQWVNQEIGYAFYKFTKVRDIIPIVDKQISNDLKGFISKNNDLNYRYSEGKNFEMVADEMVNDLQSLHENHGKYFVY